MKKRFLTLTLCLLSFVCLALALSSCGIEEKSILDYVEDDVYNNAFVAKDPVSFEVKGDLLVDAGDDGFLVSRESNSYDFGYSYHIYSAYSGAEIKSFVLNESVNDGDIKEILFKNKAIEKKNYLMVYTSRENSDAMFYLFDTDGNTVFETETEYDTYDFKNSPEYFVSNKGNNHFSHQDKLYRIDNNVATYVCKTADMPISVQSAIYTNGKYIYQSDNSVLIFDSKLRFEKAFTVAYDTTSTMVIPLESGNVVIIEADFCEEDSKKYDIITNNTILGGTIKAKLTTKLLDVSNLTFEEISNYDYSIEGIADFDNIKLPEGKTLVYGRKIESKKEVGNIVYLLLDEDGEIEATVDVPEGLEEVEKLSDGKFALYYNFIVCF